MSVKLARIEWCAVAFAVLVSHGFLAHEWFFPSSWDAGLYAQLGREIAERGLFQWVTAADLRTYGYPLILSFVYRAANALGLSFTVVLFELQLAFYMAACLFFRNALSLAAPLAARICWSTITF